MRTLSVGLGFLLLSSCSSVHYLFQAGKGQLALLNHARPISEVIHDEKTPPRIKSLLTEIPAIKKFGEDNGLKPTSNYTKYVKLDRPAAVWVVSACEKLRFHAKEWNFPIVGSFPYLGWFDQKDAENYRRELEQEGWDADVRGASAYSTLGWFPDPVLSTMISKGEESVGDLVNVVLHESVHATVYIKGQSYFNESLANFVADRLTPKYLEQNHGSPQVKIYQEVEDRRHMYQKGLHQAYTELEQLYGSSKPESEKLSEKAKIFGWLREKLKIKRELNNASLVQYKTYNSGQNDIERVFQSCGSDWRVFLDRLKSQPFPKPQMEDFGKVLKEC